jgi:hypothetical protein
MKSPLLYNIHCAAIGSQAQFEDDLKLIEKTFSLEKE